MTLLKDIWRVVLPGPQPTLDLDFTAEELDPCITYTRASTKTYFDSDRLLKTALADEWPREFDPVTGECLGRSVWGSRTNVILYSEDFTATGWLTAATTITPNQAPAPDGATAMALLEFGASGRLARPTSGLSSGASHTFSAFVRAGSGRYITLSISASTTVANASTVWFDTLTGTFSRNADAGTGWTYRNSIAFQVAPGLWRIEITATVGATTAYCLIAACSNDNGNGLSTAGASCYAWGAQLELGAFAGPYIPTTSASVTRSADQAAISNLASFGFSADSGSFAMEYDAVNNGSSTSLVALSLGDGTSAGFASLVVVDQRGILGTVAGSVPGGVNSYAHKENAKVSLTLAQAGANITARAWSNYPFGPVTGAITGKLLSGYTFLGIGGRARGSGVNDAHASTLIRRLRYWPIILTDDEMAGIAG